MHSSVPRGTAEQFVTLASPRAPHLFAPLHLHRRDAHHTQAGACSCEWVTDRFLQLLIPLSNAGAAWEAATLCVTHSGIPLPLNFAAVT
jgi:hypothetical protein